MAHLDAPMAHSETPMALNAPTALRNANGVPIEVPIDQYKLAQPQLAQTMSSPTMQEFRQFQAWKLSMSKASQAQAQPFVDLTEPQEQAEAPGKVVEIFDKPSRSTSVKRRRSQVQSDQTHTKVKRARSATIASTVTCQRSLSLRRDYPRGTSTITKPRESNTVIKTSTTTKPVSGRPVQAQYLADFKTDMTSLIQNMIQSSLSSLTSQFKFSGGKGVASRDQDLESEQNQDQEDPRVEDGGFTSEEEDPDLYHGDPKLSQFLITEEDQREFDSFNDHNEDAMSSQYEKGKTPLWKVSQENTKFYSKAQMTRHSEPTSQTVQSNDQVPILNDTSF